MIVNLKRCLSILLAVMLLIGIIPAAYAVESGADSTQPEKTVSEGTDSIDPTEPTEPTEPPDIAGRNSIGLVFVWGWRRWFSCCAPWG